MCAFAQAQTRGETEKLSKLEEIYGDRRVRVYFPAHGDICILPTKVVVVGGNQKDRDDTAERIRDKYKGGGE